MIFVTIATVVEFMLSKLHPSVDNGSLGISTGLIMAPIPIHHVIARPARKPATAPLAKENNDRRYRQVSEAVLGIDMFDICMHTSGNVLI